MANEILIYWTRDSEPTERLDLFTTSEPLKAEFRYFKAIRSRQIDPAHLYVKSNHPEVPNACYDLSAEHSAPNLEREKEEDRRWSIWGSPELTQYYRQKKWVPPTRFQARALKSLMVLEDGGEIGMASLALKAGGAKRSFNRYFAQEGEAAPIPWLAWEKCLELAGFSDSLVKSTLEPPTKRY